MTIKDIANICGVSPSTVSKILNRKDDGISEETRKRVLGVIREYQFAPYSKAIKNAAVKSGVVGVLASGNSPEVSALIFEIERRAMASGYSVMFCNTQGLPETAEKCLFILESKGVDGILSLYQDAALLQNSPVPAVLVSNHQAETHYADCIYYESVDTSYLATRFLLEKGHLKIGCVVTKDAKDIEAGYVRAHHEYDMSPLVSNIYRQNGDSVEISIAQCLDTAITAIICDSSEVAGRIYARLYEHSDSVPDAISVISVCDDILAGALSPPLTAVSVPYEKMAKMAVDALIERMETKKHIHASHKKVPLAIMERGSVCAPAKNKQGGKIVVVGSMNMDCMIFMDHVPTNGETVLSGSTAMIPGGKGANQAVGAGKLGGLVYMIGCLGNDSDGKQIYNSLISSGVKMDAVAFDDSMPTGKAYIQVPASGESTIVVHSGANKSLDRNRIGKYKQLFEGAKYCLIPLEISKDMAEYAIRQCVKRGVEVIVKPAATRDIREETLRQIDYLIPNEKELELLAPGELSVEEKADILFEKGVKNVIITLGSKGCYLKTREGFARFPAADFHPVDTKR